MNECISHPDIRVSGFGWDRKTVVSDGG